MQNYYCNCEYQGTTTPAKMHETRVTEEGICLKCNHYAFYSENGFRMEKFYTIFDKEKKVIESTNNLTALCRKYELNYDQVGKHLRKYGIVYRGHYFVVEGVKNKITKSLLAKCGLDKATRKVYAYNILTHQKLRAKNIKEMSAITGDHRNTISNIINGIHKKTRHGFTYAYEPIDELLFEDKPKEETTTKETFSIYDFYEEDITSGVFDGY